MMPLGLLSASDNWYTADLCRAAQGRCHVVSIRWLNLMASGKCLLAGSAADRNELTRIDALLVRGMPPGSLEQIVFRMDLLGELQRRGVVVINAPRALETSVDKYLTTTRLASAGILTPRTIVCQTAPAAMDGWEQLGGDVVVKPLFGGEGRGMMRVSDPDLAWRTFRTLQQINAVLYLQEFIPHRGFDLRMFVCGDQVLGMRRVNEEDWRTNISRGARGERWEADDESIALALRAADAVGAAVAGVDLLPGLDGKLYVLEVNAVPGWKSLAEVWSCDVASMVLDHVVEQVRRARNS